MYTSLVTFLYYKDLAYGQDFFQNVLRLKQVMDQGFAQVYQVSEKGFVGIVSKEQRTKQKEDTLVSLTTQDVESMYQFIASKDVVNLTDIQYFETIPLRSFFFEDQEGHHFEIQEFLNEQDILKF